MPPKRTPCLNFQRGRCNRGATCKFLHTDPPGSPSRGGGSPRPTPPRSSPAGGRPYGAGSGVPRDACRDFWETGTCGKGFDCRFQHRSKTDGVSGRGAPNPSTNDGGANEESDPFKDTFTFAHLTPTQAHNTIQKFLKDEFRFFKNEDIYLLAAILNSAAPSNKSWVGLSEILVHLRY